MFYDFERAPPAFADCALNSFECFNTAQVALKESLKTERNKLDERIKEIRRSNLAGRSEMGLNAEVKKIQVEAEKKILEEVTTVFIDTLWPTSKWTNNSSNKEIKEFFDSEIQRFTKQLNYSYGESSPTLALDQFLSNVVKAAQKKMSQKKEEAKLSKNELSTKTLPKKKFKFYDFERAPSAFMDCVLNSFETFDAAQLTLKENLKNKQNKVDERIKEMRRSNLAGRSEMGLKAEAKKMQEEDEKKLLEEEMTVVIDTLWTTSKWANNNIRKEIKEFFDSEIQHFSNQLNHSHGESSPTAALNQFLSNVVKEAQNQLK